MEVWEENWEKLLKEYYTGDENVDLESRFDEIVEALIEYTLSTYKRNYEGNFDWENVSLGELEDMFNNIFSEYISYGKERAKKRFEKLVTSHLK